MQDRILSSRWFTSLILAVSYYIGPVSTTSIISVPPAVSSPYTRTFSLGNGTCESRTINYITQTLPAVCLRNGRPTGQSDYRTGSDEVAPITTTANSIDTTSLDAFVTATASVELAGSGPSLGVGEAPVSNVDDDGALDDASFLSFEDWKRQMQESPQQDERRKKDRNIDTLEVLSEDGGTDLDFGAFLGDRQVSAPSGSPNSEAPAMDVPPEADTEARSERPIYRSKDRGRTCKERFNFASLDAGAQVMKANSEAKSTSALLSENRDYYMLNICQAKNKFFIVEMSDLIQVETVALANFEFFSSTFRQFRVSVSSRYPQKLGGWVELGTFEAQNSRDIQAFLVEDPRIWARYIRIEFLTHYGNEFYCPVSLFRVHGDTMIQEMLNMEKAARGEDDADDDDGMEDEKIQGGEETISGVLAESARDEADIADHRAGITEQNDGDLNQVTELKPSLDIESVDELTTPWHKNAANETGIFDDSLTNDVCMANEGPLVIPASPGEVQNMTINSSSSVERLSSSDMQSATVTMPATPPDHDIVNTESVVPHAIQNSTTLPSQVVGSASSTPPLSTSAQDATTATLNKTSRTSTGHFPQPTTQESFFKTVTKRLQLLEANSTLSLKYIEEQSKILREAFTKVEKRQLGKTTAFLENLNSTVIAELRFFSEQYDQIWQSTVIELETQRDQSQREIAAISARLNLLANELVFQKRMSIVQSVLLLLCLGLVVFSRGVAGGYIEVPAIHNMLAKSRRMSSSGSSSPIPISPVGDREYLRRHSDGQHGYDHTRQLSGDSVGSLGLDSQDDSLLSSVSQIPKYENDSDDDDRDDLSDIREGNDGKSPAAEHEYASPDGVVVSLSPEQVALQKEHHLRHEQRSLVHTIHGNDVQHSNLARYSPFESERQERRIPTGSDDPVGSGPKIRWGASSQGDTTYLPSPPAEEKQHDFVIARKPLPPIPPEGL